MDYEGAMSPRQIKNRRNAAAAARLCAVLAVLLCAFAFFAALSFILRHALSDDAVRRAASETDLDAVAVTDGDGRVSLSDYLTAAIADAGRDAGIIERDAKRMIGEETFREKFAEFVVTAKNGGEREVDLSFAADWMKEEPEAVNKICGKELSDDEIAAVRAALKSRKLDLGGTPTESGFVNAVRSNGLFFVFCALFAGALPAILVAGNFKAGSFLLYSGVAFLASGIALAISLLFALIKSVGAGIVVAVAVEGATKLSIIISGGAILAGVIFALISGIMSRRRPRYE